MPMDHETIYVILIIVLVFTFSPQQFRRKWKCGYPLISGIEIAMNNEMDFIQLSRYSLDVFKNKIVKPAKFILSQPKYLIQKWLNDEDVHWTSPKNGRKPILSVEDRIFRTLMFSGNNKIKLLEMFFGQKKTAIYDDAWWVVRVLAKIFGPTFNLPLKSSREYSQRVGLGVFGEAFRNGVYIMDGHKIRIGKPSMAQRDYYDGRKGYHCLSYLFVHDGTGAAVFIHGGERGATEDVTLLRNSDFGKKINQFVEYDHYVLCDGAWRHEGSPYLCRFTDRTHYTAAELAFNYTLSEKRVICENFYGRMHKLFPILDCFNLRLDKLDVFVRTLAALTNIHIKYQSPLREM